MLYISSDAQPWMKRGIQSQRTCLQYRPDKLELKITTMSPQFSFSTEGSDVVRALKTEVKGKTCKSARSNGILSPNSNIPQFSSPARPQEVLELRRQQHWPQALPHALSLSGDHCRAHRLPLIASRPRTQMSTSNSSRQTCRRSRLFEARQTQSSPPPTSQSSTP